MADSCEFQIVKKRQGKKAGRHAPRTAVERSLRLNDGESIEVDINSFRKRFVECMQEVRLAELLQDCTDSLMSISSNQDDVCSTNKVENVLDKTDSRHLHLLSYGIGRFMSCPIARYQLAFLLALKEKLKSPTCHVFDPVFSSREKEVLEDFGCNVISHNEEGKRVCNSPTVLFMPHCGKALYNNVIWANLNTLSNLVIIGNSFSTMLESTPHRLLMQTANYVIKVAPFVVETPLKSSSFVHTDVFNDLSIHTFPWPNVKNASTDFWEGNKEPEYCAEVEFIRNEDHLNQGL